MRLQGAAQAAYIQAGLRERSWKNKNGDAADAEDATRRVRPTWAAAAAFTLARRCSVTSADALLGLPLLTTAAGVRQMQHQVQVCVCVCICMFVLCLCDCLIGSGVTFASVSAKILSLTSTTSTDETTTGFWVGEELALRD